MNVRTRVFVLVLVLAGRIEGEECLGIGGESVHMYMVLPGKVGWADDGKGRLFH